jgi:hypothetical protein
VLLSSTNGLRAQFSAKTKKVAGYLLASCFLQSSYQTKGLKNGLFTYFLSYRNYDSSIYRCVMKKLIFVFISLFSYGAFADTYPTVPMWSKYSGTSYIYASAQSACDSYISSYSGATSCYIDPTTYWGASGLDATGNVRNSSGSWLANVVIKNQWTCPSGGTLSGSNCINAPACISPQSRSSSAPYSCFTPVECKYPETDQGSGVCFNWACPTGQNRNPVSKACQTPVTCGSTQAYDIVLNGCYNKKLNCPGHTHANTLNDQCLKDAPLACPAGQHDDGTWNCVADDSQAACKTNQQSGYINGIPQCINKTNAEQFAADAAAVHASETAAQTAADAAASALALDPTNATKQANNTAAQTALGTAKAADTAAQANMDSATLQSIDQTLKQNQNIDLGKTAGDLGQSCNTPPSCKGDAIMCEQVLTSFRASRIGNSATQADADSALAGHTTLTGTDTTLASLDNSGLGLGSSCPAPHTYSVLNAQMVIDLSVFCSIATIFGKLILITASFVSLRIVST